MIKYVYHIHATHQQPGETSINHYDGIIETNKKINSMDRYRSVKKSTAREMGISEGLSSAVTIQSFTLLHTKLSFGGNK